MLLQQVIIVTIMSYSKDDTARIALQLNYENLTFI